MAVQVLDYGDPRNEKRPCIDLCISTSTCRPAESLLTFPKRNQSQHDCIYQRLIKLILPIFVLAF